MTKLENHFTIPDNRLIQGPSMGEELDTHKDLVGRGEMDRGETWLPS